MKNLHLPFTETQSNQIEKITFTFYRNSIKSNPLNLIAQSHFQTREIQCESLTFQ